MVDDRPLHQDREILRRLYYDDGLTQAQIADELGCSRRTIITWMNQFDLGPGSDAPKHRLPRLLASMDADVIGDPRPEGYSRLKGMDNEGNRGRT